MPLTLQPPRQGKSPNYRIRGTYYGVRVDRTAGTADRKKATQFLNKIKSEIERGAYAEPGALTFERAALDYLRTGGDATFLDPLLARFGTTPVMHIDQAVIDEAAAAIYPNASNATRNRQVYTPMSAILKRANASFKIKRPKNANGNERTEWMTPDQAERLLDAAEKHDVEFRVFLALLLYTGLRLGEALRIDCAEVHLSDAMIFVPQTKNDEPRAVHIPTALVAELAMHPRGMDRPGEPLFRFGKNGRLYKLLKLAKTDAGLPTVKFHTCRHTWGTWMRRYAHLDEIGLLGTRAWKDRKSVGRYTHVVVTEEARQADLLPVLKRAGRGKSV